MTQNLVLRSNEAALCIGRDLLNMQGSSAGTWDSKPTTVLTIINTQWLNTIESKVLGEGLAKEEIVSVGCQLPHSCSIVVQIPSGKSLVGHVHHHKMTSLLRWGASAY